MSDLACECTRVIHSPICPKALKELTKLDKSAARSIVKAVDTLGIEPRPSGSRPLVGYPDLSRIRFGEYRVVYTVKVLKGTTFSAIDADVPHFLVGLSR